MSASSFPPVLCTEHAAGYLQHLRKVRAELHFVKLWQTPLPALLLARDIVMPALAEAARRGIARVQEAAEERHR